MMVAGTIITATAVLMLSPTPSLAAGSVTEDGHTFYTDAQIAAAWRMTTADFGLALPSGVSFRSTLPTFFKPADNKNHLYETALPLMIAAKYYRCAWLRVQSATSGATAVAAGKAADAYFSIPTVRQNLIDVDSAVNAFDAVGAAEGLTSAQYELKYDCDVLNG